MYFSPATSRSCHPALMLVHSFCLCFNTPNLMRIDLLTYRVQGHIETHTSKWFRSSPLVQDSHGLWKMLIVGFGHSWLVNHLHVRKLLSASREPEIFGKDQGSSRTPPTQFRCLFCTLTGSQSVSAWSLPMTGALRPCKPPDSWLSQFILAAPCIGHSFSSANPEITLFLHSEWIYWVYSWLPIIWHDSLQKHM